MQMSGTRADIVVLVADTVKPETQQHFASHGCRVLPVPQVDNPYKADASRRLSYKSRFEGTLMKLHLWNLTEYDRVIYMDADNVVLHNMDELFLCGDFCAVFMNMAVFHTGLLVIKPDKEEYQKMLNALSILPSYDGADQGFLTEYFSNMEYAPLFNRSAGQSHDRMNRLQIGYNMNHIYWYEKSSWQFYRRQQFANLTIPAYSLGYPITPILKPWYWWSSIIFQVSWVWQGYRNQMGDKWEISFGVRLSILVAFYFLLELLTRRQTRRFTCGYELPGFVSPTFVNFLAALLSMIGAYWISLTYIPPLIPPKYGIPLFIISNNFFLFFLMRLWCYLLPHPQRSLIIMVPCVLSQILGYYAFSANWSNPVYKMWVILLTLMGVFGVQIYTFVFVRMRPLVLDSSLELPTKRILRH